MDSAKSYSSGEDYFRLLDSVREILLSDFEIHRTSGQEVTHQEDFYPVSAERNHFPEQAAIHQVSERQLRKGYEEDENPFAEEYIRFREKLEKAIAGETVTIRGVDARIEKNGLGMGLRFGNSFFHLSCPSDLLERSVLGNLFERVYGPVH